MAAQISFVFSASFISQKCHAMSLFSSFIMVHVRTALTCSMGMRSDRYESFASVCHHDPRIGWRSYLYLLLCHCHELWIVLEYLIFLLFRRSPRHRIHLTSPALPSGRVLSYLALERERVTGTSASRLRCWATVWRQGKADKDKSRVW